MADRLGVRALTMQQPFAAAMAHGVGLYSRRGKATKFAPGGEWVAIHCGQNSEHLNNAPLLAAVRKAWPACPSDAELRAQQKCVLGVARFVEGDCDAKAAAKGDFFLSHYDCAKPVAWRADMARPCARPLSYPKGQLQVWHLARSGFASKEDAAALAALAAGSAGEVKIKPEADATEGSSGPAKAEAKAGGAKRSAAKRGAGATTAKLEGTTHGAPKRGRTE